MLKTTKHNASEALKSRLEQIGSFAMVAYASGDGSISFNFEGYGNESVGARVSAYDVKLFVDSYPAQWTDIHQMMIFFDGYNAKLFVPCQRLSETEIRFKNKIFSYQKIGHNIIVYNEEGEETKNGSVTGSISFFLEHESDMHDPMKVICPFFPLGIGRSRELIELPLLETKLTNQETNFCKNLMSRSLVQSIEEAVLRTVQGLL